MRTNTRANLSERTHEGALVPRVSAFDELRRTASACLLFEGSFYESGEDIATRLHSLVLRSPLPDVLRLAQRLRHDAGLRHAPLWLLNAALDHPSRHDGKNGDELVKVIANVCGSRGDMPGELLAMYWKDRKRPLAKALSKGLAEALLSFSSYAMQKYAARGPIRLRDVLFLTHAKPRSDEQAKWFQMLADDTLPAAETWEVALSGGANKRETFESMLGANKMGALAVLRNLRNMTEVGISRDVIEAGLMRAVQSAKFGVLPFQFVAAASLLPNLEIGIERAMMAGVHKLRGEGMELKGHTVVIVDVSGSMCDKLSAKSTLRRSDAAAALAILLRELCEDGSFFDYNNDLRVVPARRGFALRAAFRAPCGGTATGEAVAAAYHTVVRSLGRTPDRVIVITDEQSRSPLPQLPSNVRGYVMNVSTEKNGIAWGAWTTVSGFSENFVKFIAQVEGENQGG